jgi:hypothetical protein
VLRRALRRATIHFISGCLMCDVTRPVARLSILNLVWMAYAVVRFVARHLAIIYNLCKSIVARPVSRRVVYFLFQFKCYVARLAAWQSF